MNKARNQLRAALKKGTLDEFWEAKDLPVLLIKSYTGEELKKVVRVLSKTLTISHYTDRLSVCGKIVWVNLDEAKSILKIAAKAENFDDFCIGCNTHGFTVIYNGGNQTYSLTRK